MSARGSTDTATSLSTFADLLGVLEDHRPACAGDNRFTDDARHREAGRDGDPELAEMCAGCPVLAECSAFAAAGRPPGGFWAGKWHGKAARSTSAAAEEESDDVPDEADKMSSSVREVTE